MTVPSQIIIIEKRSELWVSLEYPYGLYHNTNCAGGIPIFKFRSTPNTIFPGTALRNNTSLDQPKDM